MVSYEDILRFLNNGSMRSNYEKQNGIFGISDFKKIKSFGDIEIHERKKSDGSVTMALVFKNGSAWLCWIPSHNQMRAMFDIILHYESLDQKNEDSRNSAAH